MVGRGQYLKTKGNVEAQKTAEQHRHGQRSILGMAENIFRKSLFCFVLFCFVLFCFVFKEFSILATH